MLTLRRRSPPVSAPIADMRAAPDYVGAIRTIAAQAGELGRGAAELDGVIEAAPAASARQAAEAARLVSNMDAMVASNRAIEASGVAGREAVGRAREAVALVGVGVLGVVSSLREVADAAQEITQIALQTRLVAFNATVE